MRSALTNALNGHRFAHPLVATMGGLDKEVSFVDQITCRIRCMRLIAFLLRGKQIVSEFTASKGIEKFLRIVKPDAEFADDLIAILRDIWIFEFNQTSRGSQHRLIRELPGFVCLAVIQ